MSKEKTSRFVSEVIRRYGDRYDYLKTDYHDCKLKVIITCRVHGDFMQSPTNHLAGNGCPICAESSRAKSRRSGTDEFVRKAKSKHGDKYIYDEVDYKSTYSNVTIICKTHGAFNQTPCNHLSGNGCPSCAVTGFDKNKKSYVYFLMSEKGIKVGITNKIKQRIMQLRSNTPFEFEVIKYVKLSGVDAILMESDYHNRYESAGLSGFNGCTEWLKYSPELMNEIMNS